MTKHPPPTFRPATLADLPAILEIEHLSFAHAGERFSPRTIRCLIRNPRAITLVAESDSRLLGWASGFVGYRGPSHWGRVYALAVHGEARGRRIGDSLLRHLIEALRNRGTQHIFLEVRPDNHAAVKLYEKQGFAACQTLPHFYGDGNPALRMKLELVKPQKRDGTILP
ncbi:MAG: GNAT family N-acetyltransferase [Tepidisphaeraceae bacterium]|jgi:ribosomal-protein-alanine N-acetyltransferase